MRVVTHRYFIDRDESGINAFFRLSFSDNAIEGESWVWNHWEPSATAHEVLYDQLYAKEIPESEALTIASELAFRPDKTNER